MKKFRVLFYFLSVFVLAMNPALVSAASASVFLNQTSDSIVSSSAITTMPFDSGYPVEYYINTGSTSVGAVNYAVVAHYDYGTSFAGYLADGTCPVDSTLSTSQFGGSLSPVLATTGLTSICLWGANGPIHTMKYIAGAVVYTPFEMTRSSQNPKELKDYIDARVLELDEENK